jgi:phosphoadenosine phosphosulfate reductase
MLSGELILGDDITDEDLAAISLDFEKRSPEAILHWATSEFRSEVALATGFGAEGCVLVDMIARIDKTARIFYLDTELLFR